ncbi:hypothetical protein M422DRAFT_268408 [Sphaerobolus stellatus SS14]|uniref:F-box domain-containing protein n=1 Tax=Sphaerobolus stellatus (strain SS14) TaxID=990650 RepID=A0A0C9UXF9_SPHS4|nr:hypothetical protein M422DRAFT_268408 [Sphaerobolus stellatus SS14]
MGDFFPGPIYVGPPLILKLPKEIIEEIISYFPDINLALEDKGDIYPFYDASKVKWASEYAREDALRALSQTCHALRKNFLPLLWYHFDVYRRTGGSRTMGDTARWHKQVAKALVRRSLFLANPKNQMIASYVHSCRVVLIFCSPSTVLPEFANCLASLPNLHSLEILHFDARLGPNLKVGLKNTEFLSIKKIVLPSSGYSILGCCPNAISVTCTRVEEGGSELDLIDTVIECCPKVEVLELIEPDKTTIESIAQNIPGLKRIMFRMNRTADIVDCLKPLKQLSAIDFMDIKPSEPDHFPSPADLAKSPVIKAAKEALKGPLENRKLGVIFHCFTPIPMNPRSPYYDYYLDKDIKYCTWHKRRIKLSVN